MAVQCPVMELSPSLFSHSTAEGLHGGSPALSPMRTAARTRYMYFDEHMDSFWQVHLGLGFLGHMARFSRPCQAAF